MTFRKAALDKVLQLATGRSKPARLATMYALGRFRVIVSYKPEELADYATEHDGLYIVEQPVAPGIDIVVAFGIEPTPSGVAVDIVAFDTVMGPSQLDLLIAEAVKQL